MFVVFIIVKLLLFLFYFCSFLILILFIYYSFNIIINYSLIHTFPSRYIHEHIQCDNISTRIVKLSEINTKNLIKISEDTYTTMLFLRPDDCINQYSNKKYKQYDLKEETWLLLQTLDLQHQCLPLDRLPRNFIEKILDKKLGELYMVVIDIPAVLLQDITISQKTLKKNKNNSMT